MAVATATATLFDFPKGVDNTQRSQVLRGTITVGFGTYPPGGFPITWSALANSGGGRVESLSALPFEVDVFSNSANPPGFVYLVDSRGNLRVFIAANSTSGTSGPLIEGVGPNANVPGSLVTDTIQFAAWFERN